MVISPIERLYIYVSFYLLRYQFILKPTRQLGGFFVSVVTLLSERCQAMLTGITLPQTGYQFCYYVQGNLVILAI